MTPPRSVKGRIGSGAGVHFILPFGIICQNHQFEEEVLVDFSSHLLNPPHSSSRRVAAPIWWCRRTLRWLRSMVMPLDREVYRLNLILAPFASAAHYLMLLHQSSFRALQLGLHYQR